MEKSIALSLVSTFLVIVQLLYLFDYFFVHFFDRKFPIVVIFRINEKEQNKS